MDMNVGIQIDELVLTGVPRDQADAIRIAVREELFRLVARGGLPPHLSRSEASLEIDAHSLSGNPRSVGAAIAHAIYRGRLG